MDSTAGIEGAGVAASSSLPVDFPQTISNKRATPIATAITTRLEFPSFFAGETFDVRAPLGVGVVPTSILEDRETDPIGTGGTLNFVPLAEDFFAVDFFLDADFLATDFFFADFLAVVFLTTDFFTADFLVGDFLATDRFAVAFFAGFFLAADFLAVTFFTATVTPWVE